MLETRLPVRLTTFIDNYVVPFALSMQRCLSRGFQLSTRRWEPRTFASLLALWALVNLDGQLRRPWGSLTKLVALNPSQLQHSLQKLGLCVSLESTTLSMVSGDAKGVLPRALIPGFSTKM